VKLVLTPVRSRVRVRAVISLWSRTDSQHGCIPFSGGWFMFTGKWPSLETAIGKVLLLINKKTRQWGPLNFHVNTYTLGRANLQTLRAEGYFIHPQFAIWDWGPAACTVPRPVLL
jgi:hypothetical protein